MQRPAPADHRFLTSQISQTGVLLPIQISASARGLPIPDLSCDRACIHKFIRACVCIQTRKGEQSNAEYLRETGTRHQTDPGRHRNR